MEVTEQSVVTSNNYKSIKEMLISNDEASQTLALTILEQSDYDKSEVYIMCILKDCFRTAFGTVKKFEEVSPTLFKKVTNTIKTEDVEIAKLSFKEVYDLAVKRNIEEEINFILKIFKDELIDLFTDMGYQFVHFTDILVKPKGWEEDQEKKIAELKAEILKLREGVLHA